MIQIESQIITYLGIKAKILYIIKTCIQVIRNVTDSTLKAMKVNGTIYNLYRQSQNEKIPAVGH